MRTSERAQVSIATSEHRLTQPLNVPVPVPNEQRPNRSERTTNGPRNASTHLDDSRSQRYTAYAFIHRVLTIRYYYFVNIKGDIYSVQIINVFI